MSTLTDNTNTIQELIALANTLPSADHTHIETDPTVPDWAKQPSKPTYSKSEVGLENVDNVQQYSASNPPPYPVTSVNGKTGAVTVEIPNVPTKTSELTNDSGFITGYTESDPTVPSWAKASTKPAYNKSEVGLANVDNVKQYSASNPPPYPVTSVNGQTGAVNISIPTVPTKTSDLTNDSGFITGFTESDPTVPAWAKAASKPTYTAAEIGAAESEHTHTLQNLNILFSEIEIPVIEGALWLRPM